jgi:hypothetical protein
MVDNMAKSRCAQCLRGDLHDRFACDAKDLWLANAGGFDFFTPAFVMGFLATFTPNTLAAILVTCNTEYWCNNTETTLSDPEYDMVMQQLTQICPNHPQLNYLGTPGAGTGYHRETA